MEKKENKLRPVCFVIFGITGDLARSKLIPALFNLYLKGLLPKKFKVVGYSRRAMARLEFLAYVQEIIGKKDEKFLAHFAYVEGQFDRSDDYRNLGKVLGKIDNGEFKECSNKLFYLAVPPDWYEVISKRLTASGLTIPCGGELGWTRILVEKPFGRDIKTARKLNLALGKLFKEKQIFRIDHYLGKEASLNILDFRFKKGKFEKFWNNRYVEKVELELFEKAGVKNRGAFYERIGALRDVGQNHLLQMIALITMKRPKSFKAEDVQKERAKVLENLKPFSASEFKKNVWRGQYEGYREEKGVAKNSKTETFFDLTLELKDKDWRGVPFELRSGKAFKDGVVRIKVYFKRGLENIEFNYSSKGNGNAGKSMDAYEKVLLDCILGDQTIFTSTREVEAAWEFITPILEKWKKMPLVIYPQGIEPDKFKLN